VLDSASLAYTFQMAVCESPHNPRLWGLTGAWCRRGLRLALG
jgi:hypothetical protein